MTTAPLGDAATIDAEHGLLGGVLHQTDSVNYIYRWSPTYHISTIDVTVVSSYSSEMTTMSVNTTSGDFTAIHRISTADGIITSTTSAPEIACVGLARFGTGSTVILSILIGIVAFITIAGNTLVIVAFCTDRKLRSFGNYFILNLAISDLIVGMLICVYAPALLRGCWQLTRTGCLVWLLLDYVVPLASAWNMALISLDRYWSVARPIEYRLAMSTKRAVVCMSVPWLAGIVWYGPSVLLWAPLNGGVSIVPDGKCFVEFYNNTGYLITSSFVEFVIPFVTVATINILIYLNIRRRSRGLTSTSANRDGRTTTSNVGGSANDLAAINNFDDKQKRIKAKRLLSRDKKSARSLAVLIIVFLFTWAPFEICAFVNPVCNFCIEDTTNEVVFWFLWLNSTINPILYPLLQQRFRIVFTQLLCCVANETIASGRWTMHSRGRQNQGADNDQTRRSTRFNDGMVATADDAC